MVAAGGVLAVAVLLALSAELAGRAGRVAVDAGPARGALAAAGRGVALGPVGALAAVLAVLAVVSLGALLVATVIHIRLLVSTFRISPIDRIGSK